MKSFSLLSLLWTVAGLHASVHSTDIPQGQKVCNLRCNPDLSGDWSFTADALYWYTGEQTGTDWALSTHDTGILITSQVYEVSFPWSWGFRAGVGYDTNYDNWTTQLLYTWYQTTGRNSANGGGLNSAFEGPALGNPDTTFQSGSIKWGLSFNMFDWDLGRRFYASKATSFRPFLGIKGGWISQDIYTNWETTGLAATEDFKNHFWGIGPKGGVDGKWDLGRSSGFSLFAIGEGGFLWGHWSFQDVYRSSTPNESAVKLPTNDFGGAMLHGQVGFGWDTTFNNNKSQFSARLSYEGQLWFNQIQLFSYLVGLMHQNLTLQGTTLDFRVDY